MVITIRKLACGVFFATTALTLPTTVAQVPGTPPAEMAQVPPAQSTPKRDVDAEVSRMTKQYALSNAQAAQVLAILNNETGKTEAILRDNSLLPMERLNKLKALKLEEIARVAHLLTSEQLDKYINELQQMPLPQLQPPAGFPPPPPGY